MGENGGLNDIYTPVDPMKHLTPLAGLAIAALLGGCAVYPDGTPTYGNGYGGDYSGYDGYATTVPVVPQANGYVDYGYYSGPGYYDGPGRYYGPDYRGYPGYRGNGRDNDDRSRGGGWHGQANGSPARGAVGGPGGPSGSNAPRPSAGNSRSASPPQQATNGGGRGNGNGNGNGNAVVRGVPGRQSGGMTDH